MRYCHKKKLFDFNNKLNITKRKPRYIVFHTWKRPSNQCRIVISLPLSIITLSMFDWCTLLSHHKTQMTSVLNSRTLCKALAAPVVAITLKISQGSEKAGPMTALWQEWQFCVQISWGIFWQQCLNPFDRQNTKYS